MFVPLNDNVGLMTNHHVHYMYMYMELKLCSWVSLIACKGGFRIEEKRGPRGNFS